MIRQIVSFLQRVRSPQPQTPRIAPVLLGRLSGPERHAIAHGRGLWGERNVPKAGWICVGIEDMGEPLRICEMCSSARIRYVHYLAHPARSGDPLAVGCVCAGLLMGDEEGAQSRDATMRSRAAKRGRWLKRRWRRSARSGNEWLRADGFAVTIYRRRDWGWGAVVSRERDDFQHHTHADSYSQDAAKLAAFDLISRTLSSEMARAFPAISPAAAHPRSSQSRRLLGF